RLFPAPIDLSQFLYLLSWHPQSHLIYLIEHVQDLKYYRYVLIVMRYLRVDIEFVQLICEATPCLCRMEQGMLRYSSKYSHAVQFQHSINQLKYDQHSIKYFGYVILFRVDLSDCVHSKMTQSK